MSGFRFWPKVCSWRIGDPAGRRPMVQHGRGHGGSSRSRRLGPAGSPQSQSRGRGKVLTGSMRRRPSLQGTLSRPARTSLNTRNGSSGRLSVEGVSRLLVTNSLLARTGSDHLHLRQLGAELAQLVRRDGHVERAHILLHMVQLGGAGDRHDERPLGQQPGE
jgi:hypothetical protein